VLLLGALEPFRSCYLLEGGSSKSW